MRTFFSLSISVLLIALLSLPTPAEARKRGKKLQLDEQTRSEMERTLDAGLRSGNMKIRADSYRAFARSFRSKKEISSVLKDGLKDPQAIVLAGVIDGMLHRKMKGYTDALVKLMVAPGVDWDSTVQPLLDQLQLKDRLRVLQQALEAKNLRGKPRIVKEILRGDASFALRFIAEASKFSPASSNLVMGSISDMAPSDAVKLYPSLIKKGSSAVQVVVLEQSQKLPKDISLDFLRPMLKSKDSQVQAGAAQLLAAQGDKKAAQLLLPLALDESRSVEDRVATIRLMQKGITRDLAMQLEGYLDISVPAELRGAAYGCFALAGDKSILDNVRADLAGTDGVARAAASRWLGTLVGPSAIGELKELLVDGNEQVRQNAAFSIGELKSLAMIPHLDQGLRDISPEVKLETVRALSKLQNNEVAEIVQFLAFDPDIRIRQETLNILGKAKHVATLSTLDNLLSDSDLGIRFHALIAIMDTDLNRGKTAFRRALMWLKPDQLVELARRQGNGFLPYSGIALESRRSEIRNAAIGTLSVLKPNDASALLLSFRDVTRFPDIRRAAYLQFAQSNWDEAMETFEQWILSPETSAEDLETAFTALERAPASQRVIDALKVGYQLNASFQTRATLAMLKLVN